jgi:hypothetical protein
VPAQRRAGREVGDDAAAAVALHGIGGGAAHRLAERVPELRIDLARSVSGAIDSTTRCPGSCGATGRITRTPPLSASTSGSAGGVAADSGGTSERGSARRPATRLSRTAGGSSASWT